MTPSPPCDKNYSTRWRVNKLKDKATWRAWKDTYTLRKLSYGGVCMHVYSKASYLIVSCSVEELNLVRHLTCLVFNLKSCCFSSWQLLKPFLQWKGDYAKFLGDFRKQEVKSDISTIVPCLYLVKILCECFSYWLRIQVKYLICGCPI